ncbi:DUF559 domain-containing protein [Leucobacter sp. cx-328]|uniref:DUF559 domain-containing protein n=1 Tax=unclassified Leucobacter TaxID=2621730 RepID=UPI00165DD38D|nr:DUF559 domain-containing protein [Leucobacter sp. cx-328]
MYRQRLEEAHGVTRTSELREAGLSKYALDQAVKRGSLLRIGRGWVAVPSADPARVYAAKARLTLSCVTQAERLGLWVRESGQRHFAVPRPGSELREEGICLHYWKPVEPRMPYALEDSIINVLSHVARCQPHEDAVATWDSALNKQLVTKGQLESAALGGRARRVLRDTDRFADSGLETYVRLRLRWLPVRLRTQTWIEGRRVDFLLGERLILQIDGGTHVGVQRNKDNTHDAVLATLGFTVLRFGYAQVMHDWPETQEIIMTAIRAGLHNRR